MRNDKLGAVAEELYDLARETLYSLRAELRAGTIPASVRVILMGVSFDKARNLSGQAALHSHPVNLQVNNFGPQSKEEIIARLTGRVLDMPPTSTIPAAEPAANLAPNLPETESAANTSANNPTNHDY